MAGFDMLADVTARLATTARLDDIVDAAVTGIVQLGFATVWIAVLDEDTGILTAVKQVIEGVDIMGSPTVSSLDERRPIGRGFRERRMFNVTDPSVLIALDADDDPVAPDKLAVSRAI